MTDSTRNLDDGSGDRGRRSDNADATPRVGALSSIKDFNVAEGTPDPRGWTVVDSTGMKVGKVHDLIVDTVEMRTRYLNVRLDKDALHFEDDRDVLIPVGQARLDDDDDRVVLGSLKALQLAGLPAYTHGDIDRDYESSLLPNFDAGAVDATGGGDSGAAIGAMSPGDSGGMDDASMQTASRDFYDNRHFDENRFFGKRRQQQGSEDQRNADQGDRQRMTRSEEELAIDKRRVPIGAMSIRKRVDTQHVSQPVNTTREEVTVERRPVSNADSAHGSDMGEDEIRIPVYEDEIVVDKRRVMKEEVVVKKQAVQETKNVEADLQKERIDVDDSNLRRGSSNEDRQQS